MSCTWTWTGIKCSPVIQNLGLPYYSEAKKELWFWQPMYGCMLICSLVAIRTS